MNTRPSDSTEDQPAGPVTSPGSEIPGDDGLIRVGDDVEIRIGDALDRLREMPDGSVDCVVTSPPYWGLRDYGVDGQIGMEPTVGYHIAVMVAVMREVWRVLRPGGTVWFQYGDCYATAPNGRPPPPPPGDSRTFRDKPFGTVDGSAGLKAGDLVMMPNRIALALQDAGWTVRSEIVWGKPNAMPDSSGRRRPSVAHEKIFLLAKPARGVWVRHRHTGQVRAVATMTAEELAARTHTITKGAAGPQVAAWESLSHYYDAEAVRVPAAESTLGRWSQNIEAQAGSTRANGGTRADRPMKAVGGRTDKQRGHSRRHAGFNGRWDQKTKEEQAANGRLLRAWEPWPLGLDPADLVVWDIATAPYSGAHFATFPVTLARRCILGGCPPGGLVLDPFGGAGTTALAARQAGRRALLIELNPQYAADAADRIGRAGVTPDLLWSHAPGSTAP